MSLESIHKSLNQHAGCALQVIILPDLVKQVAFLAFLVIIPPEVDLLPVLFALQTRILFITSLFSLFFIFIIF